MVKIPIIVDLIVSKNVIIMLNMDSMDLVPPLEIPPYARRSVIHSTRMPEMDMDVIYGSLKMRTLWNPVMSRPS
jgi:hypothetical protein